MEFVIMNQNFESVCVLDVYESMIWVDKYQEPGTFELYTPITDALLEHVKAGNYISSNDSEHIMIIEDITYTSDVENGNHIKAIGRSLESILDRRIVWKQTDFDNVALNTVIERLLNNAIISPDIADRKIYNFAVYTASTDTTVTKAKVNHQYTGDNLLTVIEDLCVEFKVGFKILLNEENKFVFSLYSGTNRSYSQSSNPYVIFSPAFDNVISSNYKDTSSVFKNVNLVGGVGEGKNRTYKTVGVAKGLSRREMFTDAKDIQKDSLTNSKYMALLEKRGVTKLDEANKRISFDSKCETTRLYAFGEDFFVGDIVQIANEYGIEASARISEFTWSYSNSGFETYPTFEMMEESLVSGKNKLVTTLDELKRLNTSGEWTDNVWAYSNVVLTANLDAHDRVNGITVNGTNSLSSNIVFDLGIINSDVTDLVLSGCTGGSSSTYKISQFDKTSNVERTICYDGDAPITTIDLTHENHVRFTLVKSKKVDNITLYPMVREVSDSSGYEPYDPELHPSE